MSLLCAPANEVWDKVMSSEACVSHFVLEGGDPSGQKTKRDQPLDTDRPVLTFSGNHGIHTCFCMI